jgi:L-rhamnose mutarotase
MAISCCSASEQMANSPSWMEYIDRHAPAWPEMLDEIAAAGHWNCLTVPHEDGTVR